MNTHWGRYIAVYVNCLLGTLFLSLALPGMRKVNAVNAVEAPRGDRNDTELLPNARKGSSLDTRRSSPPLPSKEEAQN